MTELDEKYLILKNENREMREKLNFQIEQNETLLQEVEELKKELNRNRKMYFIMEEYSTLVENELLRKIDEISGEKTEDIDENTDILELRTKLGAERAENEKLAMENSRLHKEIEKMNLIHSSIVSHDSALENELSSRLKKMRQMAVLDSLTGAYNRTRFYEILYEQIKMFKIKGVHFSIIMLDVDDFKQINDSFGHDAGDMVLRKISDLIRNLIREQDLFVRWGGEEFLILVPGTIKHKAKKLAERIRVEINQHAFDLGRAITCSFGVTEFRVQDAVESFVKRVDEALYQAKREGKDRVVLF
jgi:diguanylate cyclase (GGDEF)-like protein